MNRTTCIDRHTKNNNIRIMIKSIITILLLIISFSFCHAQKLIPFKLTETGQTTSYTTTYGEDADFLINPMSFTNNGDGTVTDNNTRLVWQKVDGGEMTYENAVVYCDSLTLAGYTDWRLPTGIELFSINNHGKLNPAIDTAYFTQTLADYWWTSEKRCDDSTKIWVVNAGGGIGAHPKTETVSAGGTKRFQVRAVRDAITTTFNVPHFTDNGNGTIRDNYTGLVWQKTQSSTTMTWEQALAYANTFSLAGKTDWRLPNVKELQSLNNVNLKKPSIDTNYFKNILSDSANYWSSTTMFNSPMIAWDFNVYYGIISYDTKTINQNVLLVRGGFDKSDLNLTEVLIPSGLYAMGDHFGFTDSVHPSDEIPIHNVQIDSFFMANTVATNQQFLTYLNYQLLKGLIEVRGDSAVYPVGGTDMYCFIHQYASYYSISYAGNMFSLADFRAYHPMVGVRWCGAAAYCNWLSKLNGLDTCYNTQTWACDFTKNGYRLPTEAEWEWAGRGGQINPYNKYPWGDDLDTTKANWPNSGDPYESANTALYPFTTPVGFYDGSLRLKTQYNWPGNAASYQTADGTNAFGLYDMAGNVWQFINDWYQNNYYSSSPINNPTGPDSASASPMPDGKVYHGMRGGNWYNGDMISGVNDGHSRVSNRDPSYFRGPQDPYHPWYHVGFRVVRKNEGQAYGIIEPQKDAPTEIRLYQNYPNPFKSSTTIKFTILKRGHVTLKVFDYFGKEITTLIDQTLAEGNYNVNFNKGESQYGSGIYTYKLQLDNEALANKMISIK